VETGNPRQQAGDGAPERGGGRGREKKKKKKISLSSRQLAPPPPTAETLSRISGVEGDALRIGNGGKKEKRERKKKKKGRIDANRLHRCTSRERSSAVGAGVAEQQDNKSEDSRRGGKGGKGKKKEKKRTSHLFSLSLITFSTKGWEKGGGREGGKKKKKNRALSVMKSVTQAWAGPAKKLLPNQSFF